MCLDATLDVATTTIPEVPLSNRWHGAAVGVLRCRQTWRMRLPSLPSQCGVEHVAQPEGLYMTMIPRSGRSTSTCGQARASDTERPPPRLLKASAHTKALGCSESTIGLTSGSQGSALRLMGNCPALVLKRPSCPWPQEGSLASPADLSFFINRSSTPPPPWFTVASCAEAGGPSARTGTAGSVLPPANASAAAAAEPPARRIRRSSRPRSSSGPPDAAERPLLSSATEPSASAVVGLELRLELSLHPPSSWPSRLKASVWSPEDLPPRLARSPSGPPGSLASLPSWPSLRSAS
mmetsp:Transcript_26496/g.83995  ORF Transcript_26496/g.83995 Transcript_26496/m.83995 type:complete len:294 (-) Transcript_26496:209-1090(-)